MAKKVIPRITMNAFAMNHVVRRNPWVPVWWSVALPGFGHLFMGQTLKGFLFMSWEIVVNARAHINLAIYYTFLGQIDQAKAVINYEWAMLYPLFYIFSMYDAYRSCVELNRLSELERLQRKRAIPRAAFSTAGVTSLSWQNPLMSTLWSAIVPGFGQLLNNRGFKSLALMAWYFAVVLQSGLIAATFHTLRGEFARALEMLDYQWLLFWPSIYIFGIADAYSDAVELNLVANDAFRYRMRKYIRNFPQY